MELSNWITSELEMFDLVYVEEVKEKVTELHGAPPRKWESTSKKLRDRLQLDSFSRFETFVGYRNKKKKRQIWWWERK